MQRPLFRITYRSNGKRLCYFLRALGLEEAITAFASDQPAADIDRIEEWNVLPAFYCLREPYPV